MILALVSDSHGQSAWLKHSLALLKDADLIVHLGDGAKDWSDIREELPCPLLQVRGNCDWFSSAPDVITQNVGGINAMFTHGHLYNVKQSLNTLYFAASEKGAGLVAFGHTHAPLVDTRGGIVFVNPGSILNTRTAALVTIEDGKIVPKIVDIGVW